jgi:hypothetical protein
MQPAPTVKQIVKIFNQFQKNWELLKKDKVKFDEITVLYCTAIINKVEVAFIPYYVNEYYAKVGAMYDSVDTLEFGKMRTEAQKVMHKTYLSTTLKGAFLASAYEGEKDISLSYCSYEGLITHLKNTKVFRT